jgi:hypothetical protein
VRDAFRGDPEALVVRLLEDPSLGEEELARIRALLAESEEKGK